MTKKQYFTLGLKWIGIYGFAQALDVLFGYSSGDFVRARNLAQTDGIFRVSQWFSLLEPGGLLVLALYLIKDGSYVQELAWYGEPDESMDPKSFFEVTIKLYGAYLLVDAIPNCLGLISNLTTVIFAPSYLSTSTESANIKSSGISNLVTLILGFWCILREKSVARLTLSCSSPMLSSRGR
jgi:hypothetical protein